MNFYFKVTDPSGANFRFSLKSGESITVGRKSPNTQLGIDDNLCSSKHCKIIARTNELYVEDLKSKNGVYLNGIKIIRQKIYLDDVIKIGDSVIFVDTKKLGMEEKHALSYSGSHDRAKGSLTFEIAAEDEQTPTLKAQGRKKTSSSSSYRKKGSHRNTSRSSVKNDSLPAQFIKSLLALSLDIALSFVVFIIGISMFRIIFPTKAAFLFKDGFHFSHLFDDTMSTYTLFCFCISIIFFALNKVLGKESLGEKILKVD